MPRNPGNPTWSDPGLLVLGSLASGPRHGYAIAQDVCDSLGVTLGPGTLYGSIARLEKRGLIEAVGSDDPRRRPYRLTAPGARVLAEQVAAMARFASLGRRRLARSATKAVVAPARTTA